MSYDNDGVWEMGKPESLVACEWLEDVDSIWHTGCGQEWVFTDGGSLKDHGVNFCYHCGRPALPVGVKLDRLG